MGGSGTPPRREGALPAGDWLAQGCEAYATPDLALPLPRALAPPQISGVLGPSEDLTVQEAASLAAEAVVHDDTFPPEV